MLSDRHYPQPSPPGRLQTMVVNPPPSSPGDKYHLRKLCLACGESFSKAALPSHQRVCIKKRVNKPVKLEPLHGMQTSFCYRCNQTIPTAYFDTHKCERENKYPVPKAMTKNTTPAIQQTVETVTTSTSSTPKKVSQESLKQHDAIVHKEMKKSVPLQTASTPTRKEEPTPAPVIDQPRKKSLPKESSKIEQKPIESKKQQLQESPSKPVMESPRKPSPPTQSFTIPMQEDEGPTASAKYPCTICGRKFAEQERLQKHVQACQKVAKPRKIFDATKARVKGTELEKYVLDANKKGKKEQPVLKKSNWRVKHETFLKMVRAGKAKHHVDTDSSSPQQDDADMEDNPDYVKCDYCSRKFSEVAAERHIPICKESKRRQELRNGAARGNSAKEEERKKRMSFRPPPPKTGKSSPKK